MPPTSERPPRTIIRMTPSDFYDEFVLQNFWMLKEDRGSICKAFNAAIAPSNWRITFTNTSRRRGQTWFRLGAKRRNC
jgi:hypothetical protein